MIEFTFQRSTAERYLAALARGLQLSPEQPEGWTWAELVTLAGVLVHAVTGAAPVDAFADAEIDLDPGDVHDRERRRRAAVAALIGFASRQAERIASGAYDLECADECTVAAQCNGESFQPTIALLSGFRPQGELN